MGKNVQPFVGEYGANGPHQNGKQEVNHLLANRHMAQSFYVFYYIFFSFSPLFSPKV